MQFERDEQLEDELLNEMAVEYYDPDRHQPSVTGMIRCITRTYYENEVKVDDRPSLSRREVQLLYTGLALEKVALGVRQRVLKGTFEGISWHIDHLGNERDFIEFKSTRKKMVDAEPDVQSNWQKQVLAYFKALNITEGHFVMLHVMGNYAPPFPDLRAYKVVTTQEEIDDNWAWIKQRSIVYLKAVKEGKEPEPFQWNEPWECKECPWLGLCNAKKLLGESGRVL